MYDLDGKNATPEFNIKNKLTVVETVKMPLKLFFMLLLF